MRFRKMHRHRMGRLTQKRAAHKHRPPDAARRSGALHSKLSFLSAVLKSFLRHGAVRSLRSRSGSEKKVENKV
jgi:hypothetical protein